MRFFLYYRHWLSKKIRLRLMRYDRFKVLDNNAGLHLDYYRGNYSHEEVLKELSQRTFRIPSFLRLYKLPYHKEFRDVTNIYRCAFLGAYSDQDCAKAIDCLKLIPSPGYTYAWSISMEVSLRLVNILLFVVRHKESLRDADADFLNQVVMEHYYWVLNDKEEESKGNHYLTNIAAICLVECLYGLPIRHISELHFAIDSQFNFDGTYYENSTGYHLYAVSILNVLSDFGLLHKNGRDLHLKSTVFLKAISMGEELAQIGDYDGSVFGDSYWLSKSFITYIRERELDYEYKKIDNLGSTSFLNEKRVLDTITLNLQLDKYLIYENFGLLILCGEKSKVVVRTSFDLNGKFSHAHEDIGSFSVLGYHSFNKENDRFRSHYNNIELLCEGRSGSFHAIPGKGGEHFPQAKLKDTFSFAPRLDSKLWVKDNCFRITMEYEAGFVIERIFHVLEDRLIIQDLSDSLIDGYHGFITTNTNILRRGYTAFGMSL